MQIIITEELGINPYSLYTMKAFATNHGLEFMQVDDDGSVRVRTIKPRARHARTKKAIGDLTPIAKVKAQDIVSIHRNSIDTGKMRRSSLDPTFLLA
ncbi:hypothetical protein N5J40_06530 [Aeromonas caviae]|uniref:hypothetical protein n=1 Tax=Aeromonas caviae TaxID=648 RepID=UPI00244BCDAE|nr:hypothetical protein [Aeromonas caviae]MDH1994480.1 hypothetical protein [Aeromonas caviae]